MDIVTSPEDFLKVYALVIQAALPICICIHFANLLVSTVLRAFFKGELYFGDTL